MARTPSKITKRDIDKNLYMEIVSEANNKTNIQKLLDDYVRKDESIGEWQLPDEYRTALTKRINNMDADIGVLKDAKNQKAINENIEKRLAIVEKAQGITKDKDDDDTSQSAGALIAANTTNIGHNTTRIEGLETRVLALEASGNTVTFNYQDADRKLREEMLEQLDSASSRMNNLESTIATKRSRDTLITEDDLDESVKGNIKKVLEINSATFDALGNMDAVVKRIDMIDAKADANTKAIEAEDAKVANVKSELLQNSVDKANEVNGHIISVEENMQSSLSSIRSDMASTNTMTNSRFGQVEDKNSEQDLRIRANEKAIDNVAESASQNAISIRRNTDSIADVEDRVNSHEAAIKQNSKDISTLNESKGKCFGIENGKLLSIGDADGTIIGKGMFIRAYVVRNDDDLRSFFENSVSPILDIRTGMLHTIKTAEEIAADTKAAAEEGEDPKTGDETTTEPTDDELEVDEEMKKLILRYKQTPKYTSRPECKNTFILDSETNMISTVIDDDGVIVSFTGQRGVKGSKDVTIEAGASVEYARDDASMSQPVVVYVRDDDESSKTYGKWLNSEGVATVAYTSSAYTVYNNSSKSHMFRILED